MKHSRVISPVFLAAILFLPCREVAASLPLSAGTDSDWKLSVQYLGLTWHPYGGTTPEVYPCKFDRKALLVLSIGAAANIDYQPVRFFFMRFTTALYKDCAFVMAGCVHTGPHLQLGWRRNAFNIGIGPILSYRQDWHRFREYINDDFYGDRVFHGWQYRLFWTAIEVEYLRRLNDAMEFQWSVIPGAPLVITTMVGVRVDMGKLASRKWILRRQPDGYTVSFYHRPFRSTPMMGP